MVKEPNSEQSDAHACIATAGPPAAVPATCRASDTSVARWLARAPCIVFNLRMEANGWMSMPFLAGDTSCLPLSAESVAEDLAPLVALCHEDDAAALLAGLHRSLRTMTPCNVELRLGRAADGYTVMELKAVPRREPTRPGAVEWHGFMHDVTERHRQDGEKRRLLDILEQSADFIGSATLDDGRLLYHNPAARRMVGLADDADLSAMTVSDMHPEWAAKQLREIALPISLEKGLWRGESALLHRAGHEIPVEQLLVLHRDADGKPLYHSTIMSDITERKRAETGMRAQYDQIVELNERLEATARELEEQAVELEASQEQLRITEAWYRGILQSAPDGMLLVNAAGTIILANSELERAFGYAEGELVGRPIEILVPPEVRSGHAGQRREFIGRRNNTNRPGDRDLRGWRKDGSEFVIDVTLSRLPGIAGDTTICAAVRDITERKRVEDALAAREREFRSLLENVTDVVVRYDRDCRRVYVNPAWARVNGIAVEQALGKSPSELAGRIRTRAHEFEAMLRRVMDNGRAESVDLTWNDDGVEVCFQMEAVPEFDSAGTVVGVLTVARDMSDRKRMEAALARREREFRTLVENAPDTVARYGPDGRHMYVNPAFAALIRGGAEALVGRTLSESLGGSIASAYEENLAGVFADGEDREFELTWEDKDGREICSLVRLTPEFGGAGAVESVLAVGRDITELNAFRRKIHQMAFYDPLTALPNRALFNDRLRQMITDASWHGQLAAVMLIDMDRFKAVNDTMGHAVGDELLREAAARLTACVRAYDTVARLGGDEFAILLPQIRHGDDLGRIASKVLAKFDERFLLDGREVFVSCSIGIALYPGDSVDADDLVKYADSAMYFAKRTGRNNFRFYSRDLTASARERLTLESELRRAIERHELALHYQPKVSLQDGTVVGSEALLRWQHPRLGTVPPSQFIKIAEDTGLIIDLGNWVLLEACRSAAEWNAGGAPLHQVAINLSARQFQAQDLAATVAEILRESGCRPEWIELEITESLLLDEDGKTLETLSALRAMGVSIAIDDFGTGYSALNYLARFPVDTLKIDRSFIHCVTSDNYRAELVKAILSIARCLGQQVVAEGVETLEQAAFLEAHGCQMVQGFLYSRAVPKHDLPTLPRRFGTGDAAGESERLIS